MPRSLRLVAAIAIFFILNQTADAATGDLTFVSCIASDLDLTQVTGCTDLTATSNTFRGFESVAVSGNGRHVYASSSLGNAVVHFTRDPGTGAATFAGCVSSSGSTTGCTDISGTTDALSGVAALRLSPDGANLYAASILSDSIVQMSVAPEGGAGAGSLTFVDCWSTLPAAGCTDLSGTTTALNSAGSLEFSADGGDLYTTSDNIPGAVAHFSLGVGGALTFENCISGGAIPGCTDISGTTNALELVSPIVISSDGQDVYVGADTRGAVIHFSRSAADGNLAFMACLTSATATTGCAMLTTDGARRIVNEGMTISPDGRHVYAASLAQASVVQFDRSPQTGALSQADCITTAGSTDNCRQLEGFEFQSLTNLVIAADGASVYASGLAADTVFGLDRDPGTGNLSFNDCISSTGAVPCIDLSITAANTTDDPQGLAVSPKGDNLYIGSNTAFIHADREQPLTLFRDSFEDPSFPYPF